MKKYVEFEMELVIFAAQDIVTFSFSGFEGSDHEFENPNKNNTNEVGDF